MSPSNGNWKFHPKYSSTRIEELSEEDKRTKFISRYRTTSSLQCHSKRFYAFVIIRCSYQSNIQSKRAKRSKVRGLKGGPLTIALMILTSNRVVSRSSYLQHPYHLKGWMKTKQSVFNWPTSPHCTSSLNGCWILRTTSRSWSNQCPVLFRRAARLNSSFQG